MPLTDYVKEPMMRLGVDRVACLAVLGALLALTPLACGQDALDATPGSASDAGTDEWADAALDPEENPGDLLPTDGGELQPPEDWPDAGPDDPGTAEGDAGKAQSDAGTAGTDAATAGSDAGPGLLVLHVAPTGDDSRDGLAPATALKTLQGAHTRLASYLPRLDGGVVLDRPVEVRIKHDPARPYLDQHVSWKITSPNHTISFMPSDYQKGFSFSQISGRPVFDGRGLCAKTPPGSRTHLEKCGFFDLVPSVTGAASNVHFYYLEIRNYLSHGIALYSGFNASKPSSGWNGKNTVYGCYFHHIGNKYFSGFTSLDGRFGAAGISLNNSRSNLIANNHFVYLVNVASPVNDEKYVHAVYLSHGSSSNLISGNRMERISGDPIKVRDYSNRNLSEKNTFRYAGEKAIFLDFAESGECSSWMNSLRNNTVRCGDFRGQALGSSGFEWLSIKALSGSCPADGTKRADQYDNLVGGCP